MESNMPPPNKPGAELTRDEARTLAESLGIDFDASQSRMLDIMAKPKPEPVKDNTNVLLAGIALIFGFSHHR